MKSKWSQYKSEALLLRKHGASMVTIAKKYGVPKSTLSGWCRHLTLSERHKKRLFNNKLRALRRARKIAALWHKTQKVKRLDQAMQDAKNVLRNVDLSNAYILEALLAILYMGEGRKSGDDTRLGSSDPLILKFFLSCLKTIYHFDYKKLRCELHLRADQDPEKLKRFWARSLGLSVKHFKYVSKDKRTAGSKTYNHYKGVCNLLCGHVAIKRRLLSISSLLCKKAADNLLGA